MLLAASIAAAQSLDCVVEPKMRVKVGSPIATTLESVDVKRGDTVVKGQILARLTSGVEVADVALAEARARNTAEIDSRRSKFEFAQADLSRGTRLLAGTNFQVAQQDIVTAELNHSLAILDLAPQANAAASPSAPTDRACRPGYNSGWKTLWQSPDQHRRLTVAAPFEVEAVSSPRRKNHSIFRLA